MPSTRFQPGDVVIASLPFTSGGGSKTRPVLVLADTGDDDVVVARMTSKSAKASFDVTLAEWQAAGLWAPAVVRVHKISTVDKSAIQKVVGSLAAADRLLIAAMLQQLFAGW